MRVGPVINFLGILFIFLSVFMTLPAVWAFYYHEDAWIAFLLAAIGILIGGFTIKKLTNAEHGIGIREGFAVVWEIYLFITLLGTLLLMLCGMNLFDALCHTFGALATGGFSTRNASIGAFDNPWIPWVILLIMLLGATDFALHFYALRGKPQNYFKSSQFKSCILTLAGAVVLVVAFSYPYLRAAGDTIGDCIFEVGYHGHDNGVCHRGL